MLMQHPYLEAPFPQQNRPEELILLLFRMVRGACARWKGDPPGACSFVRIICCFALIAIRPRYVLGGWKLGIDLRLIRGRKQNGAGAGIRTPEPLRDRVLSLPRPRALRL